MAWSQAIPSSPSGSCPAASRSPPSSMRWTSWWASAQSSPTCRTIAFLRRSPCRHVRASGLSKQRANGSVLNGTASQKCFTGNPNYLSRAPSSPRDPEGLSCYQCSQPRSSVPWRAGSIIEGNTVKRPVHQKALRYGNTLGPVAPSGRVRSYRPAVFLERKSAPLNPSMISSP